MFVEYVVLGNSTLYATPDYKVVLTRNGGTDEIGRDTLFEEAKVTLEKYSS